jgi:hypothetical protein
MKKVKKVTLTITVSPDTATKILEMAKADKDIEFEEVEIGMTGMGGNIDMALDFVESAKGDDDEEFGSFGDLERLFAR